MCIISLMKVYISYSQNQTIQRKSNTFTAVTKCNIPISGHNWIINFYFLYTRLAFQHISPISGKTCSAFIMYNYYQTLSSFLIFLFLIFSLRNSILGYFVQLQLILPPSNTTHKWEHFFNQGKGKGKEETRSQLSSSVSVAEATEGK